MKKNIILLALLIAISFSLSAQAPPLPPSSGNDAGKNGFVGGSGGEPGAPIGNGTIILLTLAVAYAGRKGYELHLRKVTEE
jgi:hypothetical protein